MSSTLQRAPGGAPAPRARPAAPWSRWSGWSRLLPWLLAALTVALACALPLAPVVVDTPTVRWPADARSPASTQALFMPYRPIDVTATVPCATARSVAARPGTATLLGTALADSARGQQRSLFLTAAAGGVRVLSSGRLLWSGPVPSAPGCALVVRADQSATGVRVAVPGQPDAVLATARAALVPEVVAFTTDATSADGPSPTAVAHPDARFQSRPTPLKTALLVLDVLALVACLLTLRAGGPAPAHRDGQHRDGQRLVLPAGRPALRALTALADVVVLATLAGWAVAGPIQTDDYYYSLEARTLGVAGYVGNQIRYFNVPEIPFVLEQTLLAPLASVSAAPLVLRLPSLLAGALVWWLLTRHLVPLLVERPHPALRWVAAAALLAWWLPWDIGVRPEALVALCWTLTLTLALHALRRRRAWLVGLAGLVAGLAVTITASGLSSALTLLVLLPRLWPVLRASRAGAWASTALAVACASVASTVVFADASLAGALTALRVHTEVGPNVPWWQEPVRYWYLTVGPDPNQHSFARQVVVLTTLALVVGTGTALLRVTRAPARRTGWAVPALAYLAANAALVPSPTKWSHHFGSLAGPGALAVVVAVAVLLRRRPDRWACAVLLSAVALTAGVAFHGGNNQVEYSAYAVRRTLPAVLGDPGLWLAAGLATAGVVVLRRRRRAAPGTGADDGVGDRVGDRPSGPWPEAVVGALAAVLVTALAVQVGSVALAAWRLRHTWSMAGDSLATLAGRTGCGFADTAVALTDPRRLPAAPGAAPAPAGTATAPAPLPPGVDPVGLRALAPPGSAVRSTWQPAPSPRATTVETPWLSTTSLTPRDVVAVAVTGVPGPDVRVVAQYGTAAPGGGVRPGRVVAVAVPVPADPARPGWTQVVLAPGGGLPAGADAVRLRITDDGVSAGAWVAATGAYRVVGHPLSALLPRRGVVVDWPLGFNTPCFRPPAVADGMVEPAGWLVQSATFANTPPLTVIDGGGSYSTAPQVSTVTSWPGFVPGVTPYTSWGNLVRWAPRLPAHGFRLEHGTRVVPGWRWWPGAGPGPSPDPSLAAARR